MNEPDDIPPGAERYARQIALPQLGTEGQRKLARSRVLIVGLGGLGSPAALYLGNCGVGQLTVNDFDRVDVSNLPRQILFQDTDVGEFKADAAARNLQRWNPEIKVRALNQRLDDHELLGAVASCDLALDCTDNFATRLRINEACLRAHKPLISGAAIRFEAQLTVFRHDLPDQPCYACLYSEADESLEGCAGQGILAPVTGMLGSMMATEAIKLLIGLPSPLEGRCWIYDALSGQSRMVKVRRRANCPVCGKS